LWQNPGYLKNESIRAVVHVAELTLSDVYRIMRVPIRILGHATFTDQVELALKPGGCRLLGREQEKETW
jgi:hypothetical protein